MADNPKIRDGRDRNKVSNQSWEISHVAKKLDVTPQAVVGAKKATDSTNRAVIEAYIKKQKKAGAYD